jgi:hypothetical protein
MLSCPREPVGLRRPLRYCAAAAGFAAKRANEQGRPLLTAGACAYSLYYLSRLANGAGVEDGVTNAGVL